MEMCALVRTEFGNLGLGRVRRTSDALCDVLGVRLYAGALCFVSD